MNIIPITTIDLTPEGDALYLVDQTQLPGRVEMLTLKTQEEIWDAIYHLRVRGAPAIGVAAAMGIYLAAREIPETNFEAFYQTFLEKKAYLASARPTAVNLFWALDRMEKIVLANREKPVSEIVSALHREALIIREEDEAVCRAIGGHGVELLRPGMGILTHCNAGTLATARYGTATAPIYRAHELGMEGLRVFCDETRPLLQGARLTSFELHEAGVDTWLICDNMASSVMQKAWVNIVFVGCDRVAANGDAANKIGTSGVAILAKHYGIPFYVCAPSSTIDMRLQTGAEIQIEERKPTEVTEMWYKEPMAPAGVHVYNPAFDVTDHSLITGIITEFGIAYPPFDEAFRKLGL